MRIDSIKITDFKGISEKNIVLNSKNAFVKGQNGAGKSTVGSCLYWVFGDCDYSLKSNPSVFPNDGRECKPTVRLYLDFDGRKVEVAKIQTRVIKKSNDGSGDVVSFSNTYEVNSVEYGLRDFKNKMNEYGVDFDKFLQLSHPDVFVAGMNEKKAREQMRNTLFEMAGTISELEIAKMSSETKEVAELFENYTKEEIEAMQNATLRKIKENYGKEGEILRAKIEGLESAKVDIDVAEYELGKRAVMELIKSNKAKQEDNSKLFEEKQKLSDGILELQFKLNDLQRKANEENFAEREELNRKISDKKFLVRKTKDTIVETKQMIGFTNQNIDTLKQNLSVARNNWKSANERVFDENSLVCTYCGQEYPIEKKEQLKADFESHKEEELKRATDFGNKTKEMLDKEKKRLEELEKELPEHEQSLEMLNSAIADLEKQLSELSQLIDISDREDVKAIKAQIAEKEKAMQSSNSADEIRSQLKAELEELQEQYNEFERKIAKASNNVEIDEQILELREKQGEYEQSKADCEKILYQLSLVSRKKNELLTEEINKHFKIVKWQLHDYQKNGSYIDVCIPFVDDRQFGTSTNKGREILAKLDILKGLQKFYGQNYPAFLDNAESLSEQTKNRIDMDCQLVMMSVSEDKELRIEVE